ncbi:ABC transporter permease [Streptococcus castoreus]|uniref:ABC transporter permease n=1 Tax=Streptococcus castoreus TaxID=254786 RepID=UPI00042A213C|nr:ABC transporter permease [Streptococcus castoreus]
MKTFKALLRTEYLLTIRSLPSLVLSIGMPVFFFLFYSSFVSDSQTILKLMMFNITAFSSIGFALFTLPFALQEDRRSNRLKSIRYSPVPLWQYYLAKVIRVIGYYLLSCGIVFIIGYFMRDIRMTVGDWLIAVALLVFGAVAFISLGLLLSQIKSSEVLSALANILYIGLAIIGGLWIPVSSFPKWLQAISRWTPTYHFGNLFEHYLIHGTISLTSVSYLIGFCMLCLLVTYFMTKFFEVH